MNGAAAMTFFLLSLSAGFVGMGVAMTFRLTPDRRQRQMINWLVAWFAKGALLPVILWAVMNLGVSWNLPPFMPSVQAAQNNGLGWGGEWFRVTALGSFVVTSYWATVTLGWVLLTTCGAVDAEARSQFKALCWTCAVGMGIPAFLAFWVGGWAAFGLAGAMILGPMAGYAPGILQPRKTPPMYARAIARIKFGKYAEAETEIIRELEKCEDDFEGWMMLAELYATRFSDIAEAERTVLEICDQPKLTPSQLSVALHRLADWQLKVAGEPDAARRALQTISDRLPGTHLAHMAQLRCNQLPRTVQELQEQRSGTRIPLPALGDALDHGVEGALPPMERKTAARLANACVEQLQLDPNNVPAREKLARLFTEHLVRADLGLEQLRLLLDMPDQPDNKRADWLALAAAWHLKHRDDPATASRFLERVIQEFPQSSQAVYARYRLAQVKARLARQGG